MTTAYIGQPLSRIDGSAKVTGSARYAAEHPATGLLYGYVVTSTIAKGRIARIGASDALALPGVVQVLTHQNVPRLARPDHKANEASPPGVAFVPLQDNEVRFSFQPVGLVLAETQGAAPLSPRAFRRSRPRQAPARPRAGAAPDPASPSRPRRSA